MKRTKTPVVQQHRCTTTATTHQVARQLMTELLDTNHSETYAPYVIAWRGRIGLVWREPMSYASPNFRSLYCWNYTIADGHEIANITSLVTIGTTSASCTGARNDTIAALRWSMAQAAWDGTAADIAVCANFCMPLNVCNSPATFRTWANEVLRLQRQAI